MGGSVKRDFRIDPATGTRAWRSTWLYLLELPAGPDGRRQQEKRRGFATKTTAQEALDEARDRLRDQTSGVPVERVPVPAAEAAPALNRGRLRGQVVGGGMVSRTQLRLATRQTRTISAS